MLREHLEVTLHLLHEGTTTFCLYKVADNGFSLSVSSSCCFISLIKPVNGYIGSMLARIVASSTIKTDAAPQRINAYVECILDAMSEHNVEGLLT